MIHKADYYDKVYKKPGHYKKHWKMSPYAQIWRRTLMLIPNGSSVLDIGCGTGQYAAMIKENEYKKIVYCGVDFSPAAIEIAKKNCKAKFICEDAFSFKWPNEIDVAIILEFLEHISDNKLFLERLPQGIKFIASVPNYASGGHTRIFLSAQAVKDYYKDILDITDVQTFHLNDNNQIYLFHGSKK